MKVSIVCGSPSSEFLAPFDDPEWEIWVLGNRFNRHENHRVTRIFEIHDDLSNQQQGYAEWLVSRGLPLVVGEGFPLKASNVTVFPFEKAKELFGSLYLTSSPAYMMALALLEGATHVGLYGVDMAVDDNEYFWQRPCMEAWIGFAKGRGIDVFIPNTSPVLKSSFLEGSYGKTKNAPFTEKDFLALAEKNAKQIEIFQKEIDDRTKGILIREGARQAYERLAKVSRAIEAGQIINNLTDSFALR